MDRDKNPQFRPYRHSHSGHFDLFSATKLFEEDSGIHTVTLFQEPWRLLHYVTRGLIYTVYIHTHIHILYKYLLYKAEKQSVFMSVHL